MALSHELFAAMLAANPDLQRRNPHLGRDLTRTMPIRESATTVRPEPESPEQPQKRKKYGNVPVEQGGVRYDSGKEARRHRELLILERQGEIADLKLKPKYVFEHNGVRIGSFTPDFSYVEGGKLVVEDVKGVDRKTGKKPTATEGYRLRKRLLLAFYGIEVRET